MRKFQLHAFYSYQNNIGSPVLSSDIEQRVSDSEQHTRLKKTQTTERQRNIFLERYRLSIAYGQKAESRLPITDRHDRELL